MFTVYFLAGLFIQSYLSLPEGSPFMLAYADIVSQIDIDFEGPHSRFTFLSAANRAEKCLQDGGYLPILPDLEPERSA